MPTRLCPLTEPTNKVLQENRERFSRIMTSSFSAMEVKIKDVLKTQCEQRHKLCQDYFLQFTNLNRKLTSDAYKLKKQAETLSVSIRLSFKGVHFLSIRGSNRGFLHQVWREGQHMSSGR
uniref:XLR/SYCP3/FAM9 domain-containing protein n=1 Tax=Mus spicilegus TaxID=10103 RepID=A0A8C6G829_MUSSI